MSTETTGAPSPRPATRDYSIGLEEAAGYITFLVGAWQDFGYEVPPSPECKTIPPLGERSAEAIKAGHKAVESIDELARQLHLLREQLVGELRRNDDINIKRADELLARLGSECAAAAGVDDELQAVACLRTVSTDGNPEPCGLPVDHDPDEKCPGNPHARPAAGAGGR